MSRGGGECTDRAKLKSTRPCNESASHASRVDQDYVSDFFFSGIYKAAIPRSSFSSSSDSTCVSLHPKQPSGFTIEDLILTFFVLQFKESL
jgi:hypothetical protein